MNDIFIFQNFEFSLMTFEQVVEYIGTRINNLKRLGFSNDQIMLIIFEDQFFKECFIEPMYFEKIKSFFTNNTL